MRTVRTGDLIDSLTLDGDLFVLMERRMLRLAPLAATIVELSSGGIATDELAQRLEEVFGRPDGLDLQQATDAAVDELLAEGLLIDDDAEGVGA